MRIIYIPETINGKQAQGDSLGKYDVFFDKGEIKEIDDAALAKKMLTCPFFFDADDPETENVSRETLTVAPKKRGRPRKVKNGDESPDI